MINVEWVNEWLKFSQRNGDLQFSPPGLINNSLLESKLVIDY